MNAVKDGEIEDIQAMITVISHEGWMGIYKADKWWKHRKLLAEEII